MHPAGRWNRPDVPALRRDRPAEFDIRRAFKSKGHISFGLGPHTCIGIHLARVELEVALERLITRFPDVELVTTEPNWIPSHLLRGFEALHLRW